MNKSRLIRSLICGSFKKLMKDNNLNQREFSKRIEVTEASMSRYLKLERTPSMEVLIKVTSAFDVTLDWLIGGWSYDNKN